RPRAMAAVARPPSVRTWGRFRSTALPRPVDDIADHSRHAWTMDLQRIALFDAPAPGGAHLRAKLRVGGKAADGLGPFLIGARQIAVDAVLADLGIHPHRRSDDREAA